MTTEAEFKAKLEAEHGEVLDTKQLQEKYSVIGFSAPFVVVTDKATCKKGSLEFTHAPRFYFSFTAAE